MLSISSSDQNHLGVRNLNKKLHLFACLIIPCLSSVSYCEVVVVEINVADAEILIVVDGSVVDTEANEDVENDVSPV